jgi:CheY-like chemotaxis protein
MMTPLRILVADDDPDIRAVIRMWLGSDARFAIVGEASTGEQAVSFAARERPDVAVLDLYLPGMGGLEAATTMQALSPAPAIVMFSAYPGLRPLALRAGATYCLGKDVEDLVSLMESLAMARGKQTA